MSVAPILSILITVALLVGVGLRRRVKVHVPIMWSVIVCDVALLLWVETQRGAIGTVSEGGLPVWLWCHVGLAVSVIIGYLIAAITGILLYRNRTSPIRSLHRANGWTLVVARLGMLVTTPGLIFPEWQA